MRGYRPALQLPTVPLWCVQACSVLEDGPSSTACLCLPDVGSHPTARASHRAELGTEKWEVTWQRAREKTQSSQSAIQRCLPRWPATVFVSLPGDAGLPGRCDFQGRGRSTFVRGGSLEWFRR